MQGLPASGKSTHAQELMKTENAVRINKDLLRTMLHFDRYTGKNEDLTRKAAQTLARFFLDEGKNVIVDDTNLNPKTLESWKHLAGEVKAKWHVERMDTSMEECLRRDYGRDKAVGPSVIIQFALSSGQYPKPELPVVLCDLDGTLANIDHRLHFVKDGNRDWKSFFEGISGDKLRENVSAMLFEYKEKGHQIFFVSARPDTYRHATLDWLDSVRIPSYEGLIMRRSDDHRDDTEVKRGMYESYFKNIPIETIIDDRPRVIRMWRELGIPVIDVGAGVDF